MAQSRKKNESASYRDFLNQLKERDFCRVYLFFGEESYLLEQYKKELTAALIAEGDTMNLNIHREGKISVHLAGGIFGLSVGRAAAGFSVLQK